MTTTVYLDFDNVLANTTQAVLDLYNQENTRKFSMGDITHYNFQDILGISSKKLWKYFNKAWDNCSTMLNPIESSAYQIIDNMVKNGYDIEVITGCGKPIVEYWLDYNWFPKLKVTYVKNGADKDIILGDILVDDNPKHLNYAMQNGCFPIVFDRPWNREYLLSGYERIYSLRQLEPIVANITKNIKRGYLRT